MRVEAAVTTISWIPSEAVTGLNKAIFATGFTHYDPPPPDVIEDLDALRDSDRFRFANVVGPRQTHGVTFDFVRRLLREPQALDVLGDGSQSKSYIHVEDVVDAMMLLAGLQRPGFEVFNVGTDEYVTVTQIAELVVETLGLDDVELRYSGGDRGWKGDVPVVRFASERIRALGWSNAHSTVEALRASILANLDEARAEALRQG